MAKLPIGIRPGTIIRGTLKPEHVGPALIGVLRALSASTAKSFEEINGDVINAGFPEEDHRTTEVICGIEELINIVLPDAYHYGSAEGDGCDFGIWETEPDEPVKFWAHITVSTLKAEKRELTPTQQLTNTLDGAVHKGKIENFAVCDRPDDFVRRRYVSESSGSGKYSVYEYLNGSCIRSLITLPKAQADTFAAHLNDAVTRFAHDNNIPTS